MSCTVLMVAEKPSLAQSIAQILSKWEGEGTARGPLELLWTLKRCAMCLMTLT